MLGVPGGAPWGLRLCVCVCARAQWWGVAFLDPLVFPNLVVSTPSILTLHLI